MSSIPQVQRPHYHTRPDGAPVWADITCSRSPSGNNYYVMFYTDDDGASGVGESAEMARWYGSLSDCERVLKSPPWHDLTWVSVP